MKINTAHLKELVNKVSKGVGNNNQIPVTEFIGISCKGDSIVLTATDKTNYLYVTDDIEKTDSLEVTVKADQFIKLVDKTTSKDIELTLKDNALVVKGNGTYSVELQLDDEGELLEYPNPLAEYDISEFDGKIETFEIDTIIDCIKPSLSTSSSEGELILANYYIGKNVVSTDGNKMASYDNSLMSEVNDDFIFSSELMNLLSVMNKGPIRYKVDKNVLIFDNDEMVIYTRRDTDVENYPIDALEKYLEEDFPSVCKIDRADFLSLLDRISLFVGKYDKSSIRLTFTNENIRVSNLIDMSSEIIDYQDSKNHKDFTCVIDINFLTTQIKAYASDIVELHYGRENSIKMIDNKITQVIALNEG